MKSAFDLVKRAVRAMRSHRIQFFIGPSANLFTLLILVLTPVYLILTVRSGGLLPLLFLGLWWAALVWSIVVASRDDAREGTGRWYGPKGVVATHSWDPLFKWLRPEERDSGSER